MALLHAKFHDPMQFDISKGDYHHEAEESESTGTQHGAAAARADRFDRWPECGELLCQRTSLAEIAGGEVRQEAGSVFQLVFGI
jgi:hypothetical protein